MTLALQHLRLFRMRVVATLGILYCTANLFQATSRMAWEICKVSLLGIWRNQ